MSASEMEPWRGLREVVKLLLMGVAEADWNETEMRARELLVLLAGAPELVRQTGASEMERLRAALREFGEHKVECGLWDCFYPDEITNGPIYDECTCGLSAALSGAKLPPPDPESASLRERLREVEGALRRLVAMAYDPDVTALEMEAVADAALSAQQPTPAEGGSQKGSGR